MKLYNLFKDVILEAEDIVDGSSQNVSIENIDAAIEHKYMVEIDYEEGEVTTKKRFIEPVARGTTKAGNPVVRAYQLYGQSKSNKESAWKFFRIDRIKRWSPMTKIKATEPAVGFNPTGDKSMSSVDKIAKF